MPPTIERSMNVLDKFSEHLKKSLISAQNLATSLGKAEINPLHILYGLTSLEGSISRELLAKAGIEQIPLQSIIVQIERPDLSKIEIKDLNVGVAPNLDMDARRLVERAVVLASQYKHRYIGSEHLLLVLLENMKPELLRVLGMTDTNRNGLINQLEIILKSSTNFPELAAEEGKGIGEEHNEVQKPPTLSMLATDLTDPTIQAGIDPVIGRDQEIQQVIHILARRRKNNPVLLGDPGVGKTAIVEGLAKRILSGNVPSSLKNKKIYSLDIGLLIAGTSFRGEFEQRLKQVLDEVKERKDIILFIDELHNIVGAGGGGQGALDMSNLLKPGLARGEIRCIGATTVEEYRTSIEDDPALERRFQSIMVAEPTPEQAKKILHGVAKNYEAFHRVAISNEAINTAVEWSHRYMQNRFLPDKAIDLLDEAAAAVRIKVGPTPEEQQKEDLEFKIREIVRQKQEAVLEEKYSLGLKLWEQEQKLREKLNELRDTQGESMLPPLGSIGPEEIAAVVHRHTGIPVGELMAEEKVRLRGLEEELRAVIVGQDEAVKKVAQAVRLARLGIHGSVRPLGSFLFLGPSGVGKTELAKQVARLVYRDPSALIRIDMSEYGESFNISKLIGAPAGYVGYKESGKLTEAIRRRPHSVVLLDEVEKAHPDVFNLFLQVLDDGRLTDAVGKTVHFEHAIIIFTSNIGLDLLNKQASIGFTSHTKESDSEKNEIKNKVVKELDNFFRPEFLNRLDHIVVFDPLTRKDLKAIVRMHMKDLENRLSKYRLKLMLSPQAAEFVITQSFSPEKGARAIKAYLKDAVETRIAEGLLADTVKPGQTIKISLTENKLTLK